MNPKIVQNPVKSFILKHSRKVSALSGPVLRDTARLSQRYPPIARYGVFSVSTWPIGCDTPSPFSEHFPLESMRSGGAIPPPPKGYLSDTCAIPYENKANGCDTPLCDTISKGYCAIWGGISHWAAKLVHIFGQLVHIFGELVHIFGELVHIFAWKLVSRTSKQGSRNLGLLWQPEVYNDTKSYERRRKFFT